MKNYKYFQFSLFMCLVFPPVLCIKLTDVTVDLFRSQASGIVAAFGDFNADKLTDIFIVNDAGTTVDLMQAEERDPFVRRVLIPDTHDSSVITAVMPADFDGDSYMDLLITRQPKGKTDDPVQVQIYWGQEAPPGIGSAFDITEQLRDQPALVDWDGDMLPDLLGESAPDRKRIVLVSSTKRNFTKKEVQENGPFLKPHSNAFVDVDGDFTADIIMTTEDGYEVWTAKNGDFTMPNHTYKLPIKPDEGLIGQSAFVDIDQNGQTDHLVPVCKDKDCSASVIYVYDKAQDKWVEFFSRFSDGETPWGFVPPEENLGTIQYPITLRTGDYNMDGLPDAIVFLRANLQGEGPRLQKAVLLLNVACSGSDCPTGRTYSGDWNSDVSNVHNVTSGAFFDFYDDGVLDMVLVSRTKKLHDEGGYYSQLRAYKQTSTTDACFVKVLVTSGLCYKDCKNGRNPYGVNVPGPAVKYTTTSVEGDEQHSCAGQLSQSAHFALQLPFTLFGLGQTPNFVDSIGVGIPSKSGQKLTRTWTQIIPNSQLVVIPHPQDKTSWWVMKLFATPSRLVLITGAVLIGTMGFVAGIIGILHWRERREDMKEKRQESHKFHFDAM